MSSTLEDSSLWTLTSPYTEHSAYVASSSVSFDPYALEGEDELDKVRIEAWLQHVDREMKAHRSPFIAAEVVLGQFEDQKKLHRHPERLHLATILFVLQQCVPALGEDFKAVVSAALHEILPAIAFTRTTRRTAGLEVTQRFSYMECFQKVYQLCLFHQRRIEKYAHRAQVESRVLDRMVGRLDRLWQKMCFLSWRTHCRQLRAFKDRFANLAIQSAVAHTVPTYIRRWRRNAHIIMLQAKAACSCALTMELDELDKEEQVLKSAHERYSEEVHQKLRLLEATTSRCQQASDRLEALESLYSATVDSLHEHWDTWLKVINLLFGDTHQLPRLGEENVTSGGMIYPQSITDTAALYAKRACSRTVKAAMRQVCKLLAFQNAIPPIPEINERGGAAPIPCSPPRPGVAELTAVVERISLPVVSPLHLCDVLLDDQSKINVALAFLCCLYGGGHCSLFQPYRIETERRGLRPGGYDALLNTSPRSASFGHGSSESPGRETDALEEEGHPSLQASGSRMVQDMMEGMDRLRKCPEYTEKYVEAVRECLQMNEMDRVQSYLLHLFSRWRVMGLPLNREQIEAVAEGTVPLRDRPVIHALYPADGLNSLPELVNYVTYVAEFSGWSLMSVAEKLGSHYIASPKEEARGTFYADDVAQFLRGHGDHVRRLFAWISDPCEGFLVSRSKAEMLLVDKLGLANEDAETVWQAVESVSGAIGRDDMNTFLYVTSQCMDPSPFTPAVEKLRQTMNTCLRFLLDL